MRAARIRSVAACAFLLASQSARMAYGAETGVVPRASAGVQDAMERGEAALHRDQHEAALAAFDQAIQLAPTNSLAYARRSAVHLSRGSAGFYRGSTNAAPDRGALAVSLADCDRAIALSPSDASLYAQRGMILGMAGEHDAGAADFGKAIELDPSAPRWVLDRARFYGLWSAQARIAGRAELAAETDRLALADHNRAVELAPLSVEGYIARAQFHAACQWELAVDDMHQAVSLAPTNAFLHRFLAAMYAARDDRVMALVEFNRAVVIDPSDADSHVDRGVFLTALGRHDQALSDLNTAIELDPKSARAFAARATLHQQRRSMGLALADWDAAAALSPDSRYYRSQREACAETVYRMRSEQ